MKLLNQITGRLSKEQRGFTLIEILVAVAILAAIGMVFIAAITTSNKNIGILNEKTQAEALIRSQLDEIKVSPYLDSGNYTVSVSLPLQYSMTISTQPPQQVGENLTPLEDLMGYPITTLQEITVSVFRTGSNGNRHVLSISTYKVKE